MSFVLIISMVSVASQTFKRPNYTTISPFIDCLLLVASGIPEWLSGRCLALRRKEIYPKILSVYLYTISDYQILLRCRIIFEQQSPLPPALIHHLLYNMGCHCCSSQSRLWVETNKLKNMITKWDVILILNDTAYLIVKLN